MKYATFRPIGLSKKTIATRIKEFRDENKNTGKENKNKRSATSNKKIDKMKPILLNIIVFYINSIK